MKQTKEKANTINDKKLWPICVSFGLTIGISIYILGFMLGGWLDEKTSSSPLFTIIGALLAIGASFARLIKQLHDMGKNKDKQYPTPKESR